MINHGHFLINGRKVDIASFLMKTEDTVELCQSSREMGQIKASIDAAEGRGIPSWLELDKAHFKGKLKTFPTREEIAMPVNEQLVVELYSR